MHYNTNINLLKHARNAKYEMIRFLPRTRALLLLTACISSVYSYSSKLSMMSKSTNHLFRQNAAHFNTHRCKHQTTTLFRRNYGMARHRMRGGISAASTPSMAFATETPESLFGRYPQQRRFRDNAGIVRNNVAVYDDCYDQQKEEKIIRSVRESLKTNLVKPHLEHASIMNSSVSLTHDNIPLGPPTLVLVLAVSGGCDSVALFHTVLALTRMNAIDEDNLCYSPGLSEKDRTPTTQRFFNLDSDDRATSQKNMFCIPCEVHVAHFNHEQRGENSDGDEAFVKSLCSQGSVPFHRFSWSEMSDDSCPGTINSSTFNQDVARKWRRTRLIELLSSLVKGENNSNAADASQRWGAILTAHHRDDAEETILLKLLRGSYLTNLSGMEDRSDGFQLNAPKRSHLGYFAKPLLGVRKQEIVDYLTAHGFKWREDESNSDNKYKRNKVRNQLMPLLSEIAGGEDALQKRLLHLEQQSRDLSNDLAPRAEEYLVTMSTESMFLLPNDSHTLTIVEQEALHLWVARATQRQLILSYDQMQRIRKQIENFPNRLQWTLDVGDCWNIRRNGKALAVSNTVYEDGKEQTTEARSAEEETLIPWKIVTPDSYPETNNDPHEMICVHELRFSNLPHGPDISNIVIKRVKDVSNMVFIPPWRKGRSAIEVREFLRGQKVPLHRRDDPFVLCYSDESSIHALAVYLENTNRWVVHSDFSHEKGAFIKVVLGKKSN